MTATRVASIYTLFNTTPNTGIVWDDDMGPNKEAPSGRTGGGFFSLK